MANRRLRTVNEVVEAVGRARLILITAGDTQDVSNWKRVGAFPANTHHVITKELARKGHSASPELFSQKLHPSDRAA